MVVGCLSFPETSRSLWRFAQPHASAFPILLDEDHASRFEGAAKYVQRSILRSGFTAFKVSDRRISDARCFGELLLRPI
jgi:hypothetical protein